MSSAQVREMFLTDAPAETVGKKLRVELGDPVELTFKDAYDEVYKRIGYEGESVMEVAVRNDFETIQALCGGELSCATCHAFFTFDPAAPIPTATSSTLAPSMIEISASRLPDVTPQPPTLPSVSEEEEDQLDNAMGRQDNSRLSCQIKVTKDLSRWVIGLPRY